MKPDAFLTVRRGGVLVDMAALQSVPFGEAYLRNRRIERWGRSLAAKRRRA